MNKKFKITYEKIHKEEYSSILEEAALMEAFDKARMLTSYLNKDCPIGTIYSIKKVEEVKDE